MVGSYGEIHGEGGQCGQVKEEATSNLLAFVRGAVAGQVSRIDTDVTGATDLLIAKVPPAWTMPIVARYCPEAGGALFASPE